MSGLWARYNKLLEAQPLLTKCLTSLTGFTAGDVLAQTFIEKDGKPYDIMRTVRLGSFGFLIHGSTGHYFYGFLDSKLPGTKPVTVASKVFIDQTMWNPIFGLMFFGYLNFVEGKSWDDYVKKLQADLKTAVMGSWAVWVPAHSKSGHCMECAWTLNCRNLIDCFSLFPLSLQPSTSHSSLLLNVCSTSTPSKSDTTCSFRSSETSRSIPRKRLSPMRRLQRIKLEPSNWNAVVH
jgi:protein Mpv17